MECWCVNQQQLSAEEMRHLMITEVNRAITRPFRFRDDRLPALLEQARALRPLLHDMAPEGERLRAPTPQVVDRLLQMEAFSLMLPERLGGQGLSLSAFCTFQMELAKGDPSVAWVVQILNNASWVASLTSDAIQDAIFKDGPALICGVSNPPGTARPAPGGYIVNGAWPYSSGARQASWAQCGVRLEDNAASGAPRAAACYIPMSDLKVMDSWYATGLQGTGSDTNVATEVFVPHEMFVFTDKPHGYIEPGKRNIGAPSDNLQVVPTVRTASIALLLGAAQRMLELCEADSKVKPLVATTFGRRADSAVVLAELGRIAAQLDAAEILLFDALATLGNLALKGEKASVKLAGKGRAQCAQVCELIHDSIERIMFVSGSSAFMLSNPLQRYWRDVHVGLRHVQNIPFVGYEIYGRDNLREYPNISPFGTY